MTSLVAEKIVSAREMARIEKRAIEERVSQLQLMNSAGKAIAERVEAIVEDEACQKRVSLLVGKGNNGADAFTAGIVLLQRGFEVNAFHLFPPEECSLLCREKCGEFRDEGGEVYYPESTDELAFYQKGVILDGLLGTGFEGRVTGFLAEAIEHVNQQDIFVISIDIPSGVNGNTGVVQNEAVIADETIALGLPKIGTLIEDGYAYAGILSYVDIGLPSRYIDDASALGRMFNPCCVEELLPESHPSQHKYQAGYVVALAGSIGMSGAAFFSTLAALRAGAGIVRLFYEHSMQNEVAGKPWEIIAEPFEESSFFVHAAKAGAVLVGPGIRSKEAACRVLTEIKKPTVVDGTALASVAAVLPECSQPVILTPHRGELEYLIGKERGDMIEIIERCVEFVEKTGVLLLVKGAPNILFVKGEDPVFIKAGNPGMATAGSGDVLAGIITSFLAQGLLPKEAALLGVYIHGKAGDAAAKQSGERGMIAGDILSELRAVLA